MLASAWTYLKLSLKVYGRAYSAHPLVPLIAALSLSFGIGANVAAFSWTHSLLTLSLPGVNEPGRIVVGYSRSPQVEQYLPVSFPNYLELSSGVRSLEVLAAYQTVKAGLQGPDGTHLIQGEIVTRNYFQALGTRAALGRLFTTGDGSGTELDSQVVVSFGAWQRRFGKDPELSGTSITLNGRSYSVTGVTEEGFRGTSLLAEDEFWVPIESYEALSIVPDWLHRRDGQAFQLLGRLAPQASLEETKREWAGLSKRLAEEYPESNEGLTQVVVPLPQAALSPSRRAAVLRLVVLTSLLAAIILVLTLLNISYLLLARALVSVRENRVRVMLGAPRSALLWHLVADGVLLTITGGVCSTAVAWALQELLTATNPETFGRVVLLTGATSVSASLITCAVTLGTALIVAWLVAKRILAMGPAPSSAVMPGLAVLEGKRKGMDTLVAVQVALCAVALLSGTLMLVNLAETQRVDPGFQASRLISLETDLRTAGLPEAEWSAAAEETRLHLEALPGVEAVAVAENRPLGGFRIWRRVGTPLDARAMPDRPWVGSGWIGAGFFEVAGIRMVEGRPFELAELSSEARLVVIDKALAMMLWPDDTAVVGKYILLDEDEKPYQVIGVAASTKSRSLSESNMGFVYIPAAKRTGSAVAFVIRTVGAPQPLLPVVEKAFRAQAPGLPILTLETVQHSLDRSLGLSRVLTLLFAALGGLGLALSTFGIYSTQSYLLVRRRKEMAIRVALGESHQTIVTRQVIRGGLPCILGLVCGTGLFWAVGSIARPLLAFQTSHLAPLVGVGLLLLAAVLSAYFFTGLSATRVNPAHLLREG